MKGGNHRWPWRRCLFLLLLVLSHALPVLALPEGELATAFETEIQPFWAEQVTHGSLIGVGGVSLHYAKRQVPKPRGVLLLVNGRTEFASKYGELIYDLRDLPLTTYLFDHRGQGASERLLPEPDKGHVGRFQDYVDDLSLLVDTVVRPQPGQPLILVTHSMGGTVAALYANSHPGRVQGLMLFAPMLGLPSKPFPVPLTRLLAHGASLIGLASWYVPGGGPYQADMPFAANELTHSQARFALKQRLIASSPALALGSPTYGWVEQALAGMDSIARDHRGLTMPVLLLQAGADTVVDKRAQSALCADLPDCALVEMPGARHEILMEEDARRDLALAQIRDFVLPLLARQDPPSPALLLDHEAQP